tara:strand:- start:44 stop:217 length:174 start_codon:yes stop_codon:yes gene_type:complete
MTIPDLPESSARAIALQCACEFADDWQEAIGIADSFLEYIEGDTGGIDRKSLTAIEF